jgi:hypothetical protein
MHDCIDTCGLTAPGPRPKPRLRRKFKIYDLYDYFHQGNLVSFSRRPFIWICPFSELFFSCMFFQEALGKASVCALVAAVREAPGTHGKVDAEIWLCNRLCNRLAVGEGDSEMEKDSQKKIREGF